MAFVGSYSIEKLRYFEGSIPLYHPSLREPWRRRGNGWFSLILPSEASVSSFSPNLSQDRSLEGPEWQLEAPLGFWPGRFAQGMRAAIYLLSFRPPWWKISLQVAGWTLFTHSSNGCSSTDYFISRCLCLFGEPRNHDPQGETTSQVVSVRRLCLCYDGKVLLSKGLGNALHFSFWTLIIRKSMEKTEILE